MFHVFLQLLKKKKYSDINVIVCGVHQGIHIPTAVKSSLDRHIQTASEAHAFCYQIYVEIYRLNIEANHFWLQEWVESYFRSTYASGRVVLLSHWTQVLVYNRVWNKIRQLYFK
jgi:hypothetical protein